MFYLFMSTYLNYLFENKLCTYYLNITLYTIESSNVIHTDTNTKPPVMITNKIIES